MLKLNRSHGTAIFIVILLAGLLAVWAVYRSTTPATLAAQLAGDPEHFIPSAPLQIQFSQPVTATSATTPLNISPEVKGQWQWSDDQRQLTFTPTADLTPGETYQVTLNPQVRSLTGLSFSQPPQWTIYVVTRPKVVARSPASGTFTNRRPVFHLTFDRAMDQAGLAAALSVKPAVSLRSHWEGEGWSIEPETPLAPGNTYVFKLDKTAVDTQDVSMEADYYWVYTVPVLVAYKSLPHSSELGVPIIIHFSYALEYQSVRQAFKIAPAIPGNLSLTEDEGTRLVFTPTVRLPNDVIYLVRLEGDLREANGETLPTSELFSFTTPPVISAVAPKGEAVSPLKPIEITFERLMDTATTEAALQVQPAIAGSFEWNKTTLIFKPEHGYFDETTSYTVTISSAARTADGETVLKEAYTWTFQTRWLEPAVTFGQGPRTQVVEAHGRRAIQFKLWDATDQVTFELYRLNLAQFLKRYLATTNNQRTPFSDPGGTLVKSWQVDTAQGGWGKIRETQLPEEIPPGLYLLNLRTTYPNDQLLVILTQNTVAVKRAGEQWLAWVTDTNGVPVPGSTVEVYDDTQQLLDQGQTDSRGLYQAHLNSNLRPRLVLARMGNDLTATAVDAPWSSPARYRESWQPTPTTLPASDYTAYLYTDRPIYRPDQTVYFKAILRRDDDASLSVPPANTTVTVRLRDARNNVVRTIYLFTNEFGTVSSLFRIAPGAMLGDYTIEITLGGESYRQTFKVQDYHKPDYEAVLTTDATRYVAGDTLQASVDSHYLLGQPVPTATVTIKQYYLYHSCGWDECGAEETWYDSGQKEIKGQTDTHGHFEFTLETDENDAGRRLGLEVTVDDGSHQTVSSFVVVRLFERAESLRLNTGGNFKAPGRPFEVQVTARTIFDEPVTGQNLKLQVLRWNVQTRDYTTPIHSVDLTTDAAGQANVTLTLTEADDYQVLLTGHDQRGQEIMSADWLYVFGEAVPGSARTNSSDLSVSSDQKTYTPGDTATLLIKSSFSGTALLTVERGTLRREQLVTLTAPLTRVEVPIQLEDTPNIFVAVSAWKKSGAAAPKDYPVNGQDSFTYSTNLPDSQLLVASLPLTISVADKVLNVTLTPDQSRYTPRSSATFKVKVTDQHGAGVAAEVSLALVDEAIFNLSDELSGPIFDTFYFQRPNRVQTYDSLAPRRLLDGYYCEGWCCECGGGGGPTVANPRSNFPDTAIWEPRLQTDDNGEATLTLMLPDNLTGWRLTAKAVTAETRVGESFINFVTQQPLVVRPLLPRTLTTGDQVELSAIVHNYSQAQQAIVVSIKSDLQVDDPINQTLELTPGEQRTVSWAATALTTGEAQVTIQAQAGELGDAIRLTLPVQPLAVPDVTSQVGEFSGEFETTLSRPAAALEMSTIEIELSRSIAGNLINGLEYLTGYPYGCVEQTMSKALPNAVVGRAFYQLGVGGPALPADLPPKINASLQRLYSFQHNDGGWGWWLDDKSDAYQTAWVVFGLTVTAEAGYEVDPGVIERGGDWLKEHLSEMEARTRAFALYSLAVAGQGDLTATQGLATRASELDTFSQAALALALQKLDSPVEAQQLLAVLAQTAVVKDGKVYWPHTAADGNYHAKTMASTLRSTALALEAFVRIDPNHTLESGIVRYLMSQRRAEGWGSTNETSFAILALTDHLLAKETATTSAHYTLELNGQMIAQGRLGQSEPAVHLEIPITQLQTNENQLRLTQSGGGQIYYTVTHRLYLSQSEIGPAGNVAITRKYLNPETNKFLSGPVTPGQLVKVQLNVNLPADSFYLLVEDHLPGGLEALNAELNTTSHQATAYDNEDEDDEIYYWQKYGYNNKEIRGDRVSFFITEVSAGQHVYTYYARATHAGQFAALPAEVSAMYDSTVWGRSSSLIFSVAL